MRSLDDGPDECEDPMTLIAGIWGILGEETSGSPFKVDNREVVVTEPWSRKECETRPMLLMARPDGLALEVGFWPSSNKWWKSKLSWRGKSESLIFK